MADRDLFSFTVPELQRWQGGQPVSAGHLNQVVDAVDGMLTGIKAPRQVSYPPRGAPAKDAGTRTKFCKIISGNDLEPPHGPIDLLDEDNIVAIRFVSGETGEEFTSTKAWAWPPRTYGHYKMFVGKSDVFLALYMEGAWYVRWDIRFAPVPVPDGIVTGDCSA
jgi:hypothetical protein